MSAPRELPETISLDEVCEHLQIRRKDAYRLRHEGRFPHITRAGRNRFVLREDYEAYLRGEWKPAPSQEAKNGR
jgi:predicted DNA-binding transcriptional regulator AlpA